MKLVNRMKIKCLENYEQKTYVPEPYPEQGEVYQLIEDTTHIGSFYVETQKTNGPRWYLTEHDVFESGRWEVVEMPPRMVMVESPFWHENAQVRALYQEYAQALQKFVFMQGDIPIVTHLMWPQSLDDTDPEVREAALVKCRELRNGCDLTVFGTDFGYSSGMKRAIQEYEEDIGPYNPDASPYDRKEFTTFMRKHYPHLAQLFRYRHVVDFWQDKDWK